MKTAKFNTASRRVARTSSWSHRLAYINRKLPAAIADTVRQTGGAETTRVLDFGCAEMPYRHLFPDECEYMGADLPGNPDATVEISPDGRLALDDESVDLVLSSQVLEHVADPNLYLNECWRVLKPGGRLVLSTHGLMTWHRDPVDYWRWTGEGLQKVVVDHGFSLISFQGVMGLAATGLQFFQDATLAGIPRIFWRPYCLVFQLSCALFDRFQSDASRQMNALVYILHAEKR